ncbi:hypothetical protein E3C22_04150 [Jiella endophytica]|uniref:Uncharacterized protein n=1 Tax=Jiella endophytica TaxID=2558362 RepID=A0A4Y8RW12_9HYPH|nr:hypothetical protein [Jiella endophytica]TFF27654.1 hypothetical protein E3C22_04150 [Jiella endophytica]
MGSTGRFFYREIKQFFSSGIFFMLVGSVFLYASYRTMFGTHSGLTFILVVIGVALVLYGSGTQSFGEFSGTQSEVYSAKVYLAGGAGALSIVISGLFIFFYSDIDKAFDLQRKYLEFRILPKDPAGRPVPYDDLVGFVRMNGVDLPTFRRGDSFVVLIPFPQAFEGTRTLEAYFFSTDPLSAEKIKSGVPNEIVVPFHAESSISTPDGGETLVYQPQSDDIGVISILRENDYEQIPVVPDTPQPGSVPAEASISFQPS